MTRPDAAASGAVHEPTVTPRDAAVARALVAAGLQAPATDVASVDVDGDGREDSVLHASGPVAVCIVARESAEQWRADVVPSPFAGVANQEVTCLPPIARPHGALLAMSAVNHLEGGSSIQAALALYATPPGGAPALLYTEMLPFVSDWSFRAMGEDAVELVATTRAPFTTAIPEMHKVVRRSATGRWAAAGCWGASAVDAPATEQSCTVTLPEEGKLRRLEAETFGPPPFPNTRSLVLYPGQAPARRGGPQSWCIVGPDDDTRWIELPRALTRSCPAPGGSQP